MTTAESLQSKIQRLKPVRTKIPHDVTIRAYLRAASHHNPEFRKSVYVVYAHLDSAGITLNDSMLTAINAAASMDPDLGNQIVYDLLVEPFV